ncbi:hypothetical protein PUN4_80009 [Paraburkholderia unamae]|nr:hypothetical protein PUN4_80009 [Paraburkholderia unamae]
MRWHINRMVQKSEADAAWVKTFPAAINRPFVLFF